MENLYRLIVVLALLGVLGGCGGGPADVKLAEVEAVVLLDGKPLDNATVTLMPVAESQGSSLTGTTDASGRAKLVVLKPEQKIEGEYFVGVVKNVIPETTEEETAAPAGTDPAAATKIQHIVPPKYNNPRTSGIRVSVSPGQKEVRIELSSRS
ncbi:MAG: hypothetical protein RMJ16_04920 [Thermoguttaceae bacterium]|nr:hypothetical protein [Thermoguttaceae bacterium]